MMSVDRIAVKSQAAKSQAGPAAVYWHRVCLQPFNLK